MYVVVVVVIVVVVVVVVVVVLSSSSNLFSNCIQCIAMTGLDTSVFEEK